MEADEQTKGQRHLSTDVKRTRFFDSRILPTPFHVVSSDLSHTNQWTTWNGYTVADTYLSFEQEYDALRSTAAIYDLSPIIKYEVTGEDAREFVNQMLTRELMSVDVGQWIMSPICNNHGHVIDIIRIVMRGDDNIVLVTNMELLSWIDANALHLKDVAVRDISPQYSVLGLSGPRASYILGELLGDDDVKIAPGQWESVEARGIDLEICGTNSLSERGFEIWVKPEDAVVLWERTMRAGRPSRIQPLGMHTYEACRIEAGQLRPGVDFVSARHALYGTRPRSPFELGLDEAVDLSKNYFNGKLALMELAKSGPRTKVVGLEVTGTSPVTGAGLIAEGRIAGTVTSSTWSPRLKRVLGLATISAAYSRRGTEFQVEHATNVELEPKVDHHRARIVPLSVLP